MLLTSTFWKRRYSADPNIVGKTIWLDAHPYTVIGVLPSWFVYSGSFGGKERSGLDSLSTTKRRPHFSTPMKITKPSWPRV